MSFTTRASLQKTTTYTNRVHMSKQTNTYAEEQCVHLYSWEIYTSSSPNHSCIVGHAFSLRAFSRIRYTCIHLSLNTQVYVRYPAERSEGCFDIFCGDFGTEVPDKDVKVICRKRRPHWSNTYTPVDKIISLLSQ